MRRRQFISLLGGAAAGWPLAGRAQDRMRRIGVLIDSPDDAVSRSRLDLFRQGLQQLGWIDGQNVEIDIHFGGNDAERRRSSAQEVVRLRPDVILVGPSSALKALRQITDSIPIVFVQVSDPVGQGIIKSLARPGGNITGFSNLEFSLLGKWLQTLKEVVPGIARVALMIHTGNAVSRNWYRQFNMLGSSFAIEPIAAPISESADIERVIEALARLSNGALICPGDTFIDSPPVRASIINLTARHRVPALYSNRAFVTEGGLMSYGIDQADQYRRAASYVDRILKGESPADLPVQEPIKFDLVINLKTAKALGLSVPLPLLGLADEVIE